MCATWVALCERESRGKERYIFIKGSSSPFVRVGGIRTPELHAVEALTVELVRQRVISFEFLRTHELEALHLDVYDMCLFLNLVCSLLVSFQL
jgi:hypothetical protein